MKMRTLCYSILSILALLPAQSAFSKEKFINISENRKIFMHCKGSGSPTVILVAGFPDRGDASWETPEAGTKKPTVFSAISKITKVCDYDRPGTIKVVGDKLVKSRSTETNQPISAENMAEDLHNLIQNAKIKTPVIIVAHSAGGLGARLFAMKHPKDVAGIVLVDVTNEYLNDVWTDKEKEVFHYSFEEGTKELYQNYKNAENIDFDKSFEQLKQNRNQTLPIAAIVLASTAAPDAKEFIERGTWPSFVTQAMANSIIKGTKEASRRMAQSFYPPAKFIPVKSGHYIQKEQPQLVIKLIKDMVEKVRTK